MSDSTENSPPFIPTYEDLLLPERLRLEGDSSLWQPAKPFPDKLTAHSFISGRQDSQVLRVRYFEKKSVRLFAGRIWFGPQSEGPPGHAHGGSQAALLDEGMGAVAWLSGKTVLAAKIEINFRAPLPLGTILTMRAEITGMEGRKVYTQGKLEADDGRVYSEGTGLFVVVDPESFLRSGRTGTLK